MPTSRGHGDQMGRKLEAAVAALLTEPSVAASARKVKVSERTLRAWLKQEAFAAAYREARGAALGQAVAQLQAGLGQAVRRLAQLAKGRDKALALKACDLLLAHSFKATELLDLAGQLKEMQTKLMEVTAPPEGSPDLFKELDR
jgi:hypothetical protein